MSLNTNTAARIAGRAWPTENRRPHESIAEWCRRLDDYSNLPGSPPARVDAGAERSETRSGAASATAVGCDSTRVALSAASRVRAHGDGFKQTLAWLRTLDLPEVERILWPGAK